MKNRKLRVFFTKGYGKLVLKESTPLKVINENLEGMRVFSRFNRIRLIKENNRISLTRYAVPISNNIGGYCGFYWAKNQL